MVSYLKSLFKSGCVLATECGCCRIWQRRMKLTLFGKIYCKESMYSVSEDK
jgi:hypothetical protein